MSLKLAVAGSRARYIRSYDTVRRTVYSILDKLVEKLNVGEIGHGASPQGGVDTIVAQYCQERNIKCVDFKPAEDRGWAYKRRNVELVRWADFVALFYINQITSGTTHVLKLASRMRKPYRAYLIMEHIDVFSLQPLGYSTV